MTPILGELFYVEYVVPSGDFRGFVDVSTEQLEGVVGISFALSHIYKTFDAVI